VPVVLGLTLVSFWLACTDDMDVVESTDYSSDRMTGEDIWVGSDGFDLEDLEDFPVLGTERRLPAGLGSELGSSGFSPSEFLGFPGQSSCVPVASGLGEPEVEVLGDAVWKKDGVFFSKSVGFLEAPVTEGLDAVEARDRVASEGVERQVDLLLGSSSGGCAEEENSRIPPEPEAHRSSESSERDRGHRQPSVEGDEGGQKGGAGVGKKRKNRWIKAKPGQNYAVGEDIDLGSVLQMSKNTLVGRVLGQSFSRRTVVAWVEEKWKPLLGSVPVVVVLNRGWFAFKFKCEEELIRILNQYWHLNHAPVLMKRWHPRFDASRERVDESPIWVRLPGLPLHYWEPIHFRNIGNILGTFLEADLSYLETFDQRVARILVSINLREGLAEQINLIWGTEVTPQILDYENVPFRCRRCYVYGHPASECSLPPRPGKGGRRPYVRRAEGSSRDSEPFSSDPDPSSEDLDREQPEEECGPVHPLVVEVPATQVVSVPDSRSGDPPPRGLVVEERVDAHLDLVTSHSQDGHPREAVIPGISSLTVSPSVNLFLNNVTLMGQDWVEGLRNLSLSGPLGSEGTRLSSCVRGEEVLDLNPPFKPSSVVMVTDIGSGWEGTSNAPVDPDPGTSPDRVFLSPPDMPGSGYFLRSSKKDTSAGLGKSLPVARKGRGRKSTLHKAQSRARVDLMEGKQLSIEKALRAVNAKHPGRK